MTAVVRRRFAVPPEANVRRGPIANSSSFMPTAAFAQLFALAGIVFMEPAEPWIVAPLNRQYWERHFENPRKSGRCAKTSQGDAIS